MATKRTLFPSARVSQCGGGAVRRAGLAALAIAVLSVAAVGTGCQTDGDQHWAAAMIDRWGPATPAEIARDAFDPYDPHRRRRAVSLLAAAPFGGEDPYVRMYRLLTDDRDAAVRAAAALALGLHGGVEDAEVLSALLEDPEPLVRWEAARGLQRIHSPAAVAPLMDAVRNDPDTDVRMAAAHALGQYAEPRVLEVLIGALNDRQFSVVNAAHNALITLTGEDHAPDSRDWLRWSRDNRDDRFANRQPYRYRPYDPPPGFFARMRFWRDHTGVEPQRPVGLDDADDGEA